MADYAIEICIHTVLQVGEVAALRWNCIQAGEFIIRESEHRVDHDDSASTYEIDATKNGKERRIPIGDDCGTENQTGSDGAELRDIHLKKICIQNNQGKK